MKFEPTPTEQKAIDLNVAAAQPGIVIPDLSVAINKMAQAVGMPSFGVCYPLEFGKPYTLTETFYAEKAALEKLILQIEAITAHVSKPK